MILSPVQAEAVGIVDPADAARDMKARLVILGKHGMIFPLEVSGLLQCVIHDMLPPCF